MEIAALHQRAQMLVAPFLADLEALVNLDSGTYQPEGCAAVLDYLAPRLAEAGCTLETLPGTQYGPQLVARLPGRGSDRRVLLVGHMDTVFPCGEPERRPFALREGMAYGPGVYDMKGGLLVALYALRLLAQAAETPHPAVTLLFNSDEEIGSPESHETVAAQARTADAVLVLEPTPDPDRVTVARKGVGIYRLEVHGVAAHAGVEPEKGRSAILELAHRILALHGLNGTISGVTVNVGAVSGGERANVVPDYASCLIDVRTEDAAGVQAITQALARVAAELRTPGTTARLSGQMHHQPFTQSAASAALFAEAATVGQQLGLSLRGEATGGGSDGNTAAAEGIPTLDGLGPVGGHAHHPDEFVYVDSIAPRTTLLAGLLHRLATARLA